MAHILKGRRCVRIITTPGDNLNAKKKKFETRIRVVSHGSCGKPPPVGSEADKGSGKTAPSLLVPSQWLNDWSKNGKGGGKEKEGSTC